MRFIAHRGRAALLLTAVLMTIAAGAFAQDLPKKPVK
ncbi:hypothetical protein R80B4_02282 [Fibrobacteres bacterium R8-0-B4]